MMIRFFSFIAFLAGSFPSFAVGADAPNNDVIELGPNLHALKVGVGRESTSQGLVEIVLRAEYSGQMKPSYVLARFRGEAGYAPSISSLRNWKLDFVPIEFLMSNGGAHFIEMNDPNQVVESGLEALPITASGNIDLGIGSELQMHVIGLRVRGMNLNSESRALFAGVAIRAVGIKLINYKNGEGYMGLSVARIAGDLNYNLTRVLGAPIYVTLGVEVEAGAGRIFKKAYVLESEGGLSLKLSSDFGPSGRIRLSIGGSVGYAGNTKTGLRGIAKLLTEVSYRF